MQWDGKERASGLNSSQSATMLLEFRSNQLSKIFSGSGFTSGSSWSSCSGIFWITTRCQGAAGYIRVFWVADSLRPRQSRRHPIVADVQSETRMSFVATAGTTVSTRFSLRENWTPAIRADVPLLPWEAKRSFSLSLILLGGS